MGHKDETLSETIINNNGLDASKISLNLYAVLGAIATIVLLTVGAAMQFSSIQTAIEKNQTQYLNFRDSDRAFSDSRYKDQQKTNEIFRDTLVTMSNEIKSNRIYFKEQIDIRTSKRYTQEQAFIDNKSFCMELALANRGLICPNIHVEKQYFYSGMGPENRLRKSELKSLFSDETKDFQTYQTFKRDLTN